MAKIILSTGNIVSGGPSIIRKPGANRSNLELTQSLRSNFLAAQEDYAPADNANGNGNGNGVNGDADVASTAFWTAQEGDALYVPRIDWTTAGLLEEPGHYDITVKLFLLPSAPVAQRAQYAREAIDLVCKQLRAPSVDLLIVSFPGLSFESDCEYEADRMNASQGDDEAEVATWPAFEELHRQGLARRLGLAEYGSEKLARFLKRVQTKPAVDQINIKNCCSVPPPLVQLAKEHAIELLVHSDCTDILPQGTLRELLGPEPQGVGILADPTTGQGGLEGDLAPLWVVKYTAVVRDRGVIEHKGYFAAAELKQA